MKIAVTGEGIVSAIGCNKAETLDALLGGKSGIGTMRYLDSVHRELPVGEVPLSNDQMKRRLGIPEGAVCSRTTLMAILAIREALEGAGIDPKSLSGKRVALVSGTTVGGMDLTEKAFLSGIAKAVNSPTDTTPADAAPADIPGIVGIVAQHDCGNNTRSIADYFGGITDLTTISTACSSAANAIMVGAEMLKYDEADIVIAGGTESLSKFHLNGFNSLMILDKVRCRPFDAERSGLNLGEGAGYLILEREKSAAGRHAQAHCYLVGYGNACDAYHQTASSESGEGSYLAITQALKMANMAPSEVDYINAHGTGTPNNDASETVAIQRAFGENIPPVSSTKSFTGHTTSASGGVEAVICILAMQNHFIPANLGWKTPIEGGIRPSLGEKNIELHNVLCNSFGFGGNDSSLLFSTLPLDCGPETELIPEDMITVRARSRVDSIGRLADIRKYFKPLEYRRMGKLMKASLLSSLEVLEEAGIQTPQAIITGTAYGCIENSENILLDLCNGEEAIKPTLFMQSTHNTISSNIAIKTHCHGYNTTYAQGSQSLDLCLRDAKRLLRSGRCRNVLVGCHDESTPMFNELLTKAGLQALPEVFSVSMLLECSN